MLAWETGLAQVCNRQQPLAPVWTLLGQEHVLADAILHALADALAASGGGAVDVQRFSLEDDGCADAIIACQSLSLLAGATLVVLQHTAALTPGGKSKHTLDPLLAYLDQPLPGRVLVVRVEAEKWDERKTVVKRLQQFPVVDCRTPGKEQDALKRLQRLAQPLGVQVAPDAWPELWRRTGQLSRAMQELLKLQTYTGGQLVTAADVAELVHPPLEDNVFAWVDAVVRGNPQKALRTLQDVVLSGADPVTLLALTARQVRLLAWVAESIPRGMSQQEIARRTGAHPYAVRVAADQARGLPAQVWLELLPVLADLEYAVKTGRREAQQALELAVLECAWALQLHSQVRRRAY
ncbi:MAG: DNA polymerase III subunit delta [Alicyclobacillus sp.]|nr:DNA polymerase III subunit delta [Alicyclobacillus sp.]